jgi:glycosyltransferase involved in cell wall biosynthesis
MKRVLFINRYYWPEKPATGQLLTDVAEGLAERGWCVEVITSCCRLASPKRETRRGVSICRTAVPASGDGILGKAIAFASFGIASAWRVALQVRRGDQVVVMSDPPITGFASAVAAVIRGANLTYWIQDIHPEVAAAVTRRRWLGMLEPLRNWGWRQAGRCVTISFEMAAVIQTAGVNNVSVIPNWAPAGVCPISRNAQSVQSVLDSWHSTARFKVVYSGNLGRVHDIETMVQAAHSLRHDRDIAFIIAGAGPRLPDVVAAIQARNLSNVIIASPQPRERLSASLSAADIHLVTLREGCERYVYPSKLYGIAAVGRPVIFVGPTSCEMARQVIEHRMGMAISNGDHEGLARAIRELASNSPQQVQYGQNALRFSQLHTCEKAVGAWEAALLDT